MSLWVDYQTKCNCSFLTKSLGGCWCSTTGTCNSCRLELGTVEGYGSHSDLPFYKCQSCRDEDELKALQYKKAVLNKRKIISKKLKRLKSK